MKIKSSFINWFEDRLKITCVWDRLCYLSSAGAVACVFGVFVGVPTENAWWLLLTLLSLIPYSIAGLEIILRILLDAIGWCASTIGKSFRKMAGFVRAARENKRARKHEILARKLWKGEIDRAKIEPYPTSKTSLEDGLIGQATEEFFRDQLDRSLFGEESVSLAHYDKHGDTEASVLATLQKQTRTENGRGAIKHSYRCVTVGLLLKLFPKHGILQTEFLTSFVGLQSVPMMKSVISESVKLRRQMDSVCESVYIDDHTALPKQQESKTEHSERPKPIVVKV
ncbi:MAG: hypothetical protein WCT19_01040 [Candidatus Paceibacterota bacterium]|jgi:hypothetical protein